MVAQHQTSLEAQQKVLPDRLHLLEAPAVEPPGEPFHCRAWMRRLDLDALTD